MAVSVQDLLDKIHFHVIYSTETALAKSKATKNDLTDNGDGIKKLSQVASEKELKKQ